MSSPRCPTCYRRLYGGISQEIHDIVECTLAEVKPPSKSRPAKTPRVKQVCDTCELTAGHGGPCK